MIKGSGSGSREAQKKYGSYGSGSATLVDTPPKILFGDRIQTGSRYSLNLDPGPVFFVNHEEDPVQMKIK